MIGPRLTSLTMITALTASGAVAAGAQPALERGAVESYVDSQILPALKQSGVPGAVVVIVRRAGTVLAKGYGVADLNRHMPVDPDRTLFDIASIGKTMTAIVTLQLVDEGRLDLDTDVDRYLKSASVRGPRVTLRMLLGHRGGFDSDLTDLFVPFDGNPSMSRAELSRLLRPIAPPGRVTAYDNQGYGVIGLVLRDVTGESLPELFRRRLFEPLGMTGAVLGRPVDGDARLARCYVVHSPGDVSRCRYWLYRDAIMGAGGVAAAGHDMALYMRMLLNGGTLNGHRVLSAHAFSDLTNFDDYRFNPGMPGMGRAFTQLEEFRGLEYAHGGAMPGFSSLMTIYPDADVGVFISFLGGQLPSYNARLSDLVPDFLAMQMSAAARRGIAGLQFFTEHFVDRFIPADMPRSSADARPSVAQTLESPSGLTGDYYPTEQETRSLGLRMVGWLAGIPVMRAGDNSLTVAGQGPYHLIGPNLFENSKRQRIAFADLAGDQFMAVHLSPAVYERKNWLQEPGWSLLAFPLLFIVVLSALPHLRRNSPPRLRQLAIRSAIGLAALVAGLCCELQFARELIIGRGDIVLPLVWRTAAWCGAGILLLGGFGFVFRPAGAIGSWGFAHGLSVALAAIALMFIWALWSIPLLSVFAR